MGVFSTEIKNNQYLYKLHMLTYIIYNDIINSSNKRGGESNGDWRRGDRKNIIFKQMGGIYNEI